MPISAYVGLTGHGKSYGAVENVIIPALKAKRTIFTNIPMKTEHCMADFDHCVVQFDTQDILDDPDWFQNVFTDGAILVFDEVWRCWPAGMKVADIRIQHKTFLAEHRHLVGDGGHSTEIILVTQDLAQLATFSTMLVDTTYRTTKLSKLGKDKNFRVDVFTGAVKGAKPSMKLREREIYGKFKEKQGDAGYYYISHTKSAEGAGNEKRTDNRFNILKGGAIKLFIVGFLALAGLVYFFAKSFYDNSQFVTHEETPKQNIVVTENTKKLDELKSLQSSRTNEVSAAAPVHVVSSVAKERDLISRASSSYILGHIEDIFYYKISLGNTSVFLTNVELIDLGYEIETPNPCLNIVKGFNKEIFLLCHDGSNRNVFDEMVN